MDFVHAFTPALHRRVVPRTLTDLTRRYATAADCHAWAEPLQACPRCGDRRLWWRPTRLDWRCRGCGADATLAALTAWERSHVPLPAWFEIAWYVAERATPILAMGQRTSLARASLHRVLARIRGDAKYWADCQALSGAVEVDETFLGWNRRHGRASRPAVVILAERHARGRVLAVDVPDTLRSTLERVVTTRVAAGSVVLTDGWRGYNGLAALGYAHRAVNVSASGLAAHQLLPKVHSAAMHLKSALDVYRRPPELRNLPLYLGEWSWRHSGAPRTNERWSHLVTLLAQRRQR